MSIGYLPSAHTPDCPVYDETLKANPFWKRADFML